MRESSETTFPGVPPVFEKALKAQGFSELTEIQEAVLVPGLEGRDLRISSQTGSGKTVALGLVIGRTFLKRLEGDPDGYKPSSRSDRGPAVPKALLVAPTRELASQLGRELSWLFGGLKVGVAVVTGGTPIGGDVRALGAKPEIVVGTPGRLVDHLERGRLDLQQLEDVVLDEADEMLDMGFRDELEAILSKTPENRRTHLVSATFPKKVQQLADHYQRDAKLVEGTVRKAHDDISHSAIVCDPQSRTDVIVNLLLMNPDGRMLVFVRTRVAASKVAGELSALGFRASALSGEMAQRERARCLAEFRARRLQCVVATDVAARGIDIRGIQQIVHYDPPDNAQTFTHRSGRTGRAGEKGESILLISPRGKRRADQLFGAARVNGQWRPVPTAAKIRKARRRRLIRKYGAPDLPAPPAEGVVESGPDRGDQDLTTQPETAAQEAMIAHEAAELNGNHPVPEAPEVSEEDAELFALAKRLIERRSPVAVIADLLKDVGVEGPTEPRDIREFKNSEKPYERTRGTRGRPGEKGGREYKRQAGFVAFHITWGFKTGANPKRLLAHVCRRGDIKGNQVGSINIHEFRTVVDIAESVAEKFERETAAPDPSNPKVYVTKFVPYEQRQGGGAKKGRGPGGGKSYGGKKDGRSNKKHKGPGRGTTGRGKKAAFSKFDNKGKKKKS